MTEAGLLGQRRSRPGGFTLLEVLISMTILGMAISVTFVVQLAALKRVRHTEDLLKGTAELRYATDRISQAVRSSPLRPAVEANGTRLWVAEPDLGFATVEDGTWIDELHNVKGFKANMPMMKLSNVTLEAVARSVFKSTKRPDDIVTAATLTDYFITTPHTTTVDLNDVLKDDDPFTIPATPYGPQLERVVKNISNNSGTKTLTTTEKLDFDVPQGTRIVPKQGKRVCFEVVDGDLRFYPNPNTKAFSVLAHNITATPLSDPKDTSSALSVPFTINVGAEEYVTINLQKLPQGTSVGRTIQGVQTNVFTRTDPLIQ